MLSHETTRRSFGARRDLAFSELLDAPTFPEPLRVALTALESQCLVTLAEVFARLRAVAYAAIIRVGNEGPLERLRRHHHEELAVRERRLAVGGHCPMRARDARRDRRTSGRWAAASTAGERAETLWEYPLPGGRGCGPVCQVGVRPAAK